MRSGRTNMGERTMNDSTEFVAGIVMLAVCYVLLAVAIGGVL